MYKKTDKPQTKKAVPQIGGIFYGNIVVLASFIIVMMGWGIFYVYGVFFNPLVEEFGWTRAVTSGACSICVLVSGFVGIFIGRLSDRIGPKKVIITCTIILALGYGLMFFIQEVWQFYFLYGVVIATGISASWAPTISTVARWFVKRRGLMTGIVGGGISISTLVLAPAITGLIQGIGWRLTYVVIGISILVVCLIAVRFIKSSPSEMGLQAYGESKNASQTKKNKELTLKQAYHTHQFWMVCLIYFCFGLLHLSVMVHIVPQAIGMGISAISASIILSIMGGVSFVGRLIMGSLSDRIKVKSGAIISLALLTVGLIWLQQTDRLWEYYVFAVIFGLGYGGLSCMQSLLAVELFGLSAVGVITAIFSFSFNVGGSIGPVLSGYIYDISGSYQWAFIICLILSLVALLVSLYPKKPVKVV